MQLALIDTRKEKLNEANQLLAICEADNVKFDEAIQSIYQRENNIKNIEIDMKKLFEKNSIRQKEVKQQMDFKERIELYQKEIDSYMDELDQKEANLNRLKERETELYPADIKD